MEQEGISLSSTWTPLPPPTYRIKNQDQINICSLSVPLKVCILESVAVSYPALSSELLPGQILGFVSFSSASVESMWLTKKNWVIIGERSKFGSHQPREATFGFIIRLCARTRRFGQRRPLIVTLLHCRAVARKPPSQEVGGGVPQR